MSKELEERQALHMIERSLGDHGWFGWEEVETLDNAINELEELRKRNEQALEQAQKQEKLLELYKDLSNYVDEQTYAHELPEITQLKIIIKELEKQ